MRRSILDLLVVVAVLIVSTVTIGTEEKSAKFYFDRGVEEAKKGRHDRAIADFTRAIEAVSIIKVWQVLHGALAPGKPLATGIGR